MLTEVGIPSIPHFLPNEHAETKGPSFLPSFFPSFFFLALWLSLPPRSISGSAFHFLTSMYTMILAKKGSLQITIRRFEG